jgi:hypothetical protein
MDLLTFTQSSLPISLSQLQITSLLKFLENLEWGELLRAVDMYFLCEEPTATHGRG